MRDDLPEVYFQGEYDYLLVGLSVFIAIFSSYVAFVLAARIKKSQLEKESEIWTWMASCFMGVGIWVMHFIGMLAYELPFTVEYDLAITFLSVVPAILASYIVLSPRFGRFRNIVVKSILMGAGIGSMHYLGMTAMKIPGYMAYDVFYFILSVVLAVVLSGISLRINDVRQVARNKQNRTNIMAALVMGIAISAMHYVGMAAMYIWGVPETALVEANPHSGLAETLFSKVLVLSLLLIIGLEFRTRVLSGARLKAVLSAVQEAVISINYEGNIEFVNDSACRMFGYTSSELIGCNVKMLMPERYALDHDNHVHNSLHTNERREMGKSRLLEGKKKNGDIFPITLSISPVSASKMGAFVGTIRDMSDLRNQEAFMQTIFDTVPLMVFVKDAHTLQFSQINKMGLMLLGKDREDVVGKRDLDLFPKKEAEYFEKLDKMAIEQGTQIQVDEEPVHINGEIRYLRTKKMPIKDTNGQINYVLGVSEDITDLKHTQVELEHINQRIAFAADAAQIGIWEWDMGLDKLIWDETMFKLFDIDEEKFTGHYSDWTRLLHPDDYVDITESLQSCVIHKSDFHDQFRIITRSGQVVHIKADGRFYDDRMIGINYDITERVLAENKIRQMAEYDHLTELANRASLVGFMETEIARCARTKLKLVVLYLDLNKFKPINDTYGHKVGDEVLVNIASKMSKVARKTDLVARVGGDEFVVVLSEVKDVSQVTKIIERYKSVISEPFDSSVGPLSVGTSVGCSVYPDDAGNIDDLLQLADENMFNEKKLSGEAR